MPHDITTNRDDERGTTLVDVDGVTLLASVDDQVSHQELRDGLQDLTRELYQLTGLRVSSERALARSDGLADVRPTTDAVDVLDELPAVQGGRHE
jgi:hypothetical protein